MVRHGRQPYGCRATRVFVAGTMRAMVRRGSSLGFTLFACGLLGVLYLALEPYVRRTSPAMLVSWSRLLAGSWRDPLVGRDVLIGCLLAAMLEGLQLGVPAALSWMGSDGQAIAIRWVRPWNGTPEYVAYIAFWLVVAVFWALGMVFLLFVMRLLVRNLTAAAAGVFLLLAIPAAVSNAATPLVAAAFVAGTGIQVAALVRFGLLTLLSSSFAAALLREGPSMLPFSVWYSGLGITSVPLFATIAIYGFRTSLGGRSAFADIDRRVRQS